MPLILTFLIVPTILSLLIIKECNTDRYDVEKYKVCMEVMQDPQKCIGERK